ncbi:hypothetical protein K1T71_012573 [Dendrolimus kikuchii]|uniref:Uncharacterized protein n=1 Tax=Dendrolimus kikuchii TaxID=765133 RepID=A0ACC1CJQ1_9NEOP|nr:hypothetical protein K1T71_012573 [Dendrolimus kikuchii]
MDRCRCEDYSEAVKKLKFYTIGTKRPDIIDNYDRSGYVLTWLKHGVDYDDMKFSKPKAYKIYSPEELPDQMLSKETKKIQKMWCPFMTPVKI